MCVLSSAAVAPEMSDKRKEKEIFRERKKKRKIDESVERFPLRSCGVEMVAEVRGEQLSHVSHTQFCSF